MLIRVVLVVGMSVVFVAVTMHMLVCQRMPLALFEQPVVHWESDYKCSCK